MGGVSVPVVEVMGAAKSFGGAQALAGVSVEIHAGEVHGLVGENGAGKSTLGKLIAGVISPDEGSLVVDGDAVDFRGPRDALRHGIAIVEQELALVPAMTAIENVLLGYHPPGGAEDSGSGRIDRLVSELGLEVELGAPTETLSLVDQQKVEILRALYRGARLVVMDEPTARLARPDAEALIELMREISSRGTAVVFVSHFLEEVLAVADRVTVLRDGRLIDTFEAVGKEPADLVRAMLGREATLTFPPKPPVAADAPEVLVVEDLSGPSGVDGVSFTVRSGEIVALAGLVGSGRTEVARMIFGADRRRGGRIELGGEQLAARGPRDAIRRGVAYVPESRKDSGLFLTRSAGQNICASHLAAVSRWGVLRRRAELREAAAILERLQVKPAQPLREVGTFSGGNQQKILFGKWLWRMPRLLIADEPTRGIDVGAKFAIYELLNRLATEGLAILLISSELEEVLGLAHKVVVMNRGRAVATLADEEVCEEAVMHASFQTDRQRAAI